MYVQWVRFRLKPGSDRAHFMALIAEMLRWLQAQPGFAGYTFFDGERECADLLRWQTRADCMAAERAFMQTALSAQLIALVEPEVEVFFGAVSLEVVA
ncbi:hypothetical protein SAMN02745857_04314 [Andreprevotia lacus DSM 23236]|jgi:hypothetical protein|uniref:Quinol monooxygenase YgiN n=1 Tax=Andreprevotia lacus DSM 23236 TaxID=1121001 RepID=A0A1W1Y176_9NEIS|nr:hypothetical protein [Andreprevotia lacus]SMC29970.1 hypothetical protein SAMN02745857_04314 [Andreprevotia lacus DSM 23236]